MGRLSKLPQDYVLVNCAECGCELSASLYQARGLGEHAPPLVGGRVNGRPYCSGCLSARRDGS